MVETEEDDYKLNSEGKAQNLRVCLIDNQDIGMILTDKNTQERYSAQISLGQLQKLSQAFFSVKKIIDALTILKETIEAGKISLIEDRKLNLIVLSYEIKDYPALEINLIPDSQAQVKEVEVLPSTFDYQGNKEAEEKYGNTTENTTKYVDPIIQSNVKPPIVELELVEPILQVHYPDGTTKSTALPPRIQGANGAPPNLSSLSEEQFKSIREQLKLYDNFSYDKLTKQYKSNSVEKKTTSNYSTSTTPHKFNTTFQNQFNTTVGSTKVNNNEFPKVVSDYSTMTMTQSPVVFNNYNYISQTPIPTLLTQNFNNTNYFQNTTVLNNNNLVERRPRMINMKPNQRNDNRSFSTGHDNIHQFNPQKFPDNKYQYQTDTFTRNKINNFQRFNSQNNLQMVHGQTNLTQRNQDFIEKIRKQQERIKEVQRQLAQIKLQQKQLQEQKRLLMQKKQINQGKLFTEKNTQISNQRNFQKIRSQEIRQVNSFTNQNQTQFQSNIRGAKTQMKKPTPPLSNQTAYANSNNNNNNTPMSSITQKQIELAQIASMQNYANPNYHNLQAITLETQSKIIKAQEVEEQQEQVQQEKVQEEQSNDVQNQEVNTQNDDMNIEALFQTEEGKIIFRNGLLRGIIHKYAEIDDIVSKIQDILVKGVKFNLAYKAFDDGDKAKIFHQKCDNLNMSLVLVETDKDVRFGGFTTKSWKGNCTKKLDKNAFVFSLDNNKIFDIIENQPAIGCYPKFGPVFFGCQIRIYDDFFTNGGTTCHRGLNYKTVEDYELNNGEQKYLIKDIEVYSIETIEIQ